VIAFFSSSEVLRAAIRGGCLGPAGEVAVFSISEESGAVEVQGLSVRVPVPIEWSRSLILIDRLAFTVHINFR
jgi:hypothetical protein